MRELVLEQMSRIGRLVFTRCHEHAMTDRERARIHGRGRLRTTRRLDDPRVRYVSADPLGPLVSVREWLPRLGAQRRLHDVWQLLGCIDGEAFGPRPLARNAR